MEDSVKLLEAISKAITNLKKDLVILNSKRGELFYSHFPTTSKLTFDSGSSGNKTNDKYDEYVIKKETYDYQIEIIENELKDLKFQYDHIKNIIVDDELIELECKVYVLKVIEKKPVKQIANELKYSTSHLYRLLKKHD